MFLSNPARYFVFCGLLLAGVTGCGYLRSGTGGNVRFADADRESAPFSTKEPDEYQAEIVISAGGVERRLFAARKNGRSRIDYDRGTPGQRTVIRSDRDIVYSERLNIYADAAPSTASSGSSELENDITLSLLNSRPFTTFESMGTVNGLSTYRARAAGESGETIISVDDGSGLPVKQEMFSVAEDGTRTLQYSVELRDVRLEAGDALFAVPKNARRVPLAEFRRATSQK